MKLLIVDNDLERGQRLCSDLSEHEPSLRCVLVGNKSEARARLETPFDAVVSQERLGDEHGGQLLEEVARISPETIRLLVVPAVPNRGLFVPFEPTAHQVLLGESSLLVHKLRQCARVRKLITDPWLRKVIGQGNSLPSPPSTLIELQQLFRDPDASASALAQVIEKDMALSASILRLATSAYFGLPRKIQSVAEAVMYVGVETVKALALSNKLFGSFRLPAHGTFSLEALQAHSLAVAQVSKNLFISPAKADEAFLAGLFHDLGKLVLASRVPTMYSEVLRASAQGGASVHHVERELFGTTHGEVGAYILGLWGFSASLVDAVLLHHTELLGPGPELNLAFAVGYADALAKGREPPPEQVDSLAKAGVDVARGRWFAKQHRLLA